MVELCVLANQPQYFQFVRVQELIFPLTSNTAICYLKTIEMGQMELIALCLESAHRLQHLLLNPLLTTCEESSWNFFLSIVGLDLPPSYH